MAKRMHPPVMGNVKVYCVASGKGGVGKTSLSVNMGLVIQSLGKMFC